MGRFSNLHSWVPLSLNTFYIKGAQLPLGFVRVYWNGLSWCFQLWYLFLYLFHWIFVWLDSFLFVCWNTDKVWYSSGITIIPLECLQIKTNTTSGVHWICTSVTVSRRNCQRCSINKVFLEILQNSQENTCVRVSFFAKFSRALF